MSNTDNQRKQQFVSRFVIGAPQGRSGKTTFTLGLLSALRQAGVIVQPFKKGPDYIDPSWHTAAAGRNCRNLDSFFMSKESICSSIVQASQGADLAVIEGAMGFYDGMDMDGSCSTAEMAKITRSPVILVIDATRMTRSAAAMVMGYQHFDPEVRIAGVVLNKVARARHEKTAREAIEKFCGIPVVGAIPKDLSLTIPDRHLGLVTQGEMDESLSIMENLGRAIKASVDISKICSLAKEAPALNYEPIHTPENVKIISSSKTVVPPRIGVIRDQAFSFYYQDNLDALKRLGAQLIFINSITDYTLPEIDALYIGGGFPEIFAQELAANTGLRRAIKTAGENNLPIYAECGGLMYLGRSIIKGDTSYEMVGLLPFDAQVENKPQGHGYTIMEPLDHNSWFQSEIRGHEFHNSRIVNSDSELKFAFKVKRGHGIDGNHDGIIYKNTLAAYNHVHALASPAWATNFVNKAWDYAQTKWAGCQKAAGV